MKNRKWQIITVVLLIALSVIAWGGNMGMENDAVRAAAVLTTSYVASSTFVMDRGNQLNLLCSFTIGSATAVRIKVEFSADKTTWVQETDVTLSGGVATHQTIYHRMTATGQFDIAIPTNYDFYRVSALAEDSGTNTSLAITAVKSRL